MSRCMGTANCCLLLMLAGCQGTTAPSGTGAEAEVRDYYEALVRRDWDAAYAVLHPDSRKNRSSAQFARQAEAYRRQLGFEPQEVVVRSCEEHGAEALAHVVVKAGSRSYKDAIVLRKDGASWGVVVPPRFGEKR